MALFERNTQTANASDHSVIIQINGDGNTINQAEPLLALFETPAKDIGGYVAFNLIGNKWQGSTAMAPKNDRSQRAILNYLEKMRRGTLLYRRP